MSSGPARRAVAAIAATASLLAAVAVAGVWQERRSLDRSRAELAAANQALVTADQQVVGTRNSLNDTRSRLATTVAELGSVTASLGRAVSALSATQGKLASSQSVAHQLQGSLASARQSLTVIQGTLTTTQGMVFLEGGQISVLRTCLSGVTRALNQQSVGDQNGALASLQGAAASCAEAQTAAAGGPTPVYPYDFADPFILPVGSTYFGFATNAAGGNIQMIESTDLTHWTPLGRDAMSQLPSWALPHGTWGPSVLSAGGGYVLYYSAWYGLTQHHCIGRATSATPTGPYIDNSSAPLVCQLTLGGSIDPSPFRDSDGTPYLVWKSDGGSGQAAIWAQQLSADGLSVVGQPVRLLQPDQSWQAGVVEGPDLVLLAGKLHLLYSANNWDSSAYAIGDATCGTPLGPCSESGTGPILSSVAGALGPGGPATFTDASGGPWLAYHAWDGAATGYPNSRKLFLAPLSATGASITVGS